MANLSAAIRQIRRTRQRLDASPSGNFDRYRQEYETILGALADIAGDPAFHELKRWMVKTTSEQSQLPTPAEVRQHARKICKNRGVTIPQDSPLRD